MVDTKFPYRKGEAFLESEIHEVSGYFDEVLIFPVDALARDLRTRDIQERNVRVFPFETVRPVPRKAVNVLKSLFSMWCYHGPVKERFYDAVFANTAKAQARKIERVLDGVVVNGDRVVIYSYWLYITARIGVELKKYCAKRGIAASFVSRAHRFDIYEAVSGRGYLPQRQLLLEAADTVYACSEDGADYLRTRYPEYAGKVKTGYLGTYDHGLGRLPDGNKFTLVSCSRVTPIKRVALIVDALQVLETRGHHIRWVHIGDGPELEAVKSKASVLTGTDTAFVGSLPNSEVYSFYEKNPVSVFVNVSSSEGLPVSIMEAISFGIPVIATDVGGSSEIVKTSISGTLVREDISPEELAGIINRYISMDTDEYEKLRKTTREYWLDHYQAGKNYRQFAEDISMKSLD
nr:glycosyltransferase [Bifidobacterium simiiventris]